MGSKAPLKGQIRQEKAILFTNYFVKSENRFTFAPRKDYAAWHN